MPLEIGDGRTIFRTAATKFGDIHSISAAIWKQAETSRLQNKFVGALLLSQTLFKVFTVDNVSLSGLVQCACLRPSTLSFMAEYSFRHRQR